MNDKTMEFSIGTEQEQEIRKIILMVYEALKEKGYKVDTPRIRKIINHIRVSGLVRCVVATSDGYYIATTRGEVEDYLKSLENREGAIHAVRMSLESQMKFL